MLLCQITGKLEPLFLDIIKLYIYRQLVIQINILLLWWDVLAFWKVHLDTLNQLFFQLFQLLHCLFSKQEKVCAHLVAVFLQENWLLKVVRFFVKYHHCLHFYYTEGIQKMLLLYLISLIRDSLEAKGPFHSNFVWFFDDILWNPSICFAFLSF